VKTKKAKRKVAVEVTFLGDGSIKQVGDTAFSGGVPAPSLGNSLEFGIAKEFLGKDGLWNPRDGAATVKGGFQINVHGTSRGYRELGRYFLALAEIDSSVDEDYHEHVEILSRNKQARLHLIVRKNDSPMSSSGLRNRKSKAAVQ
jgi:hypothetical protein